MEVHRRWVRIFGVWVQDDPDLHFRKTQLRALPLVYLEGPVSALCTPE